MWLVTNDWCGLACAGMTYFIVVFVYFGFIRIGIWEQLVEGDYKAYLHFVIFQYHCYLIFWSHWKCMTSEPGILPDQKFITFNYLPSHLREVIKQVGQRMKGLEAKMR